jgi:hypothetical protein
MAIRLINLTGSTSKIGFLCKIAPNNKNAFVYASDNETNILGVIAESVPNRSECDVITSGEALVYVNSNAQKGDVIRSRKTGDTISSGSSIVAKTGDAPYLQIGLARQSGRGLILCHLLNKYVLSDGGAITWDDITGKPTTFPPSSHTHLFSEIGNPSVRVVTASTTELTTDVTIVCNKSAAMSVDLLAATGSNRIRRITNIGAGTVTVNPNLVETINGELTQPVYTDNSMDIQDYAVGKWIII